MTACGAVLIAALFGGCDSLDQTATESALDNDPDTFTLAEQVAAVVARDAVRKQAYKPGLRTQLPPAEWIEHAYHGGLVDANYDPIVWDDATLTAMQVSMFDQLYPSYGAAAAKKYGDLGKLFAAAGLSPGERLEGRATAIDGLLAVADPQQTAQARWRAGLMRGGVGTVTHDAQYTISPSVLQWILSHGVPTYTPPPGEDYVAQCQADGVPIPPDWPDEDRWYHQGSLAFNFLGSYEVNVHTYVDPFAPEFSGICYALPRTSSTGALTFLGIICQNKLNGKACFWDNIERQPKSPRRLSNADFPLRIGYIGDGYTLSENCTNCHRGDNVFNIHPGTALAVDERWTTPLTRYSPIGRSGFVNPPPIALTAPTSPTQGNCTSCHTLPEVTRSYCASVLRPAAETTMPRRAPLEPAETWLPASWPGSTEPVRPDYAIHIGELSSLCASAPLTP